VQAAPAAAGNEVTQHHVKVVAVVAADATAEVVVVARLLRETVPAAVVAAEADWRLVQVKYRLLVVVRLLAMPGTLIVKMPGRVVTAQSCLAVRHQAATGQFT